MGSITGEPIGLFRFSESDSGLFPSDSIGTFNDLRRNAYDETSAINSVPPIASGLLTGFGRVFTGATSTGIEHYDSETPIELRRSCTIQAILRFNRASQSGKGVVVSSGIAGGDDDLQACLYLEAAPISNRARVGLSWNGQDSAGVEFVVPSPNGPLLITAVREWNTATDVVVRYYLNDQFIGREDTSNGTIESNGHLLTVGCSAKASPFGYENYFEGIIESLAIFDYPMTAEQVRQIFRRIAILPAVSMESIQSLLPKDVWSRDPSSIIQREFHVEAAILSQAESKIYELQEDFLPDRAWSFLERWETITSLIPKPNDNLTVRRNRLLTAFGKVESFSIPGVKDALSESLGIGAGEIEVLENTHILEDPLGPVPDFIFQDPGNGSISDAGTTTKFVANAIDADWFSRGSVHGRITVDRNDRADEPAEGMHVTTQMFSAASTLDGIIGGVGFADFSLGSMFVVGYTRGRASGALEIVGLIAKRDGTYSFAPLQSSPTESLYINLRFLGATRYMIGTATSLDLANYQEIATITVEDVPDPKTAIIGAFPHPNHPITGAADRAVFQDFRLYTPRGPSVFQWFAYRNPALGGSFDRRLADIIINRIKPCHTQGSFAETKELACDDIYSTTDGGPLGS